MGFFKSKKGSIISDHFKLIENIGNFTKGYMYEVSLYDDHLEVISLQKKKLILNYNQITDVFYGMETELKSKPKSVIGRAGRWWYFIWRRWCCCRCDIRQRSERNQRTALLLYCQL